MNPVLEVTAHKTETNALRRTGNESMRQTRENLPPRGGPLPLWLKARAQTLGLRRDDLVRMHWRKVWRSMVED